MTLFPFWLGPTLDIVFSSPPSPLTVSATELISERLKRIRLKGDLSRLHFWAGKSFLFRVGPKEYRPYCPSLFYPEAGRLELLIYLGAQGPGSCWAERVQAGDKVHLQDPGRNYFHYRPESRRHFFFGDETSLGLIQCMKTEIVAKDQEYLCLLELESRHVSWPILSSLMADSVPKQKSAVANYLDDMSPYFWSTWKEASFYLSGKASSVGHIRKQLLQKGIPAPRIQSQVYWTKNSST